METTISKFGKLDYLVNNGGGQFIAPFSHINTKGWNAVVDTNLNGTYYCLREAYNTWMRDNGGSIVNIVVDNWNGMPLMSYVSLASHSILVYLHIRLFIFALASLLKVEAPTELQKISIPIIYTIALHLVYLICNL